MCACWLTTSSPDKKDELSPTSIELCVFLSFFLPASSSDCFLLSVALSPVKEDFVHPQYIPSSAKDETLEPGNAIVYIKRTLFTANFSRALQYNEECL